ncbi:nucleotide pyrophosphohydrolase [Methanobrevibacter sp. DSM 116169]|uniref:nucleotide pyrophosphohydrolase n=1 Tax=Methanobrevibacter sp. DSM 116169 TaxID=3242727 RepID=UPI0038FCCC91
MDEVIENLLTFQKERNWKKFHTPENLAKSINIEASELLEHFQWNNNYNLNEVSEELADVLIYSFLMAETLNLDIKKIILNKLQKNKEKYPISKSKGNSTKYTKF